MASKQRQDVTAIIYDKRGKVLSVGKNSYVKTHPYQAKQAAKANNPLAIYLHAEIAAIIKCRDLRKAYRMEVIRVNRNGQSANACPCKICASAIEAAGIRHVSHT